MVDASILYARAVIGKSAGISETFAVRLRHSAGENEPLVGFWMDFNSSRPFWSLAEVEGYARGKKFACAH